MTYPTDSNRLVTRLTAGAMLAVALLALPGRLLSAEPVSHVWVAGDDNAVKLLSETGEISLTLEDVDSIRGIAIDDRRSLVWLVTCRRELFAYDFDGVLQTSTTLPVLRGHKKYDYEDDDDDDDGHWRRYSDDDDDDDDDGSRCRIKPGQGGGDSDDDDDDDDNDSKRYKKKDAYTWVRKFLYYIFGHYFARNSINHAELVVDVNDGAVWVGAHSALFKVSNSGDVLVEKKLYSNVETLAFDRELQRLWVGTRRSVKAYDTDGLEVMQLPFSRWIRIKRIAFDEKFNELWVATLGSLRRFDREGTQIFKERVYGIRQLASDGKGAAWVAGTKFALKINRDGDFLDRVRIPRRGGIFGDIAIDQNDGLLWALTSRYITREQVGNKYLELLHRHRKKRHIAANGDI
ncbi:MAG: hypothetical protein MJA83_14580, partial [Gammaproteobacteria bacterium]|nr:hypothetical protein [Gammaproteobacteria bacterium]